MIEHAIPWHNLFAQAFNFTLLFGLLAYLLKEPIKKHFADRAAGYRELVDRAENARREAERTNHEIKERLARLEATAQRSAEQARAEAADLRSRMMQEAKNLATKMEQEAQRTTAVELEKAKMELRRELLTRALSAAGEELQKNLGSSDQKKLQNEFVEKIEVVSG